MARPPSGTCRSSTPQGFQTATSSGRPRTGARSAADGAAPGGDGAGARPATRLRLIEEAERLFAVRGFAGVSLREIGAAAGARNNSAAQYHFGSRQGLVDAVFDHRMAAINERRLAMLAALDADSAETGEAGAEAGGEAGAEAGGEAGAGAGGGAGAEAGDPGREATDTNRLARLVAAMVVPLAETYGTEPHSTYYARFSSQVMADPALVGSIASLDRPVMTGLREVYARIAALLAAPADPAAPGHARADRAPVDVGSSNRGSGTRARGGGVTDPSDPAPADHAPSGAASAGHAGASGLPESVIGQRLRLASTLFVRALADYEADRDAGMPIPASPFPAFVSGLVDALTGLLRAPHRNLSQLDTPQVSNCDEFRRGRRPTDPPQELP